VVGSGPAGPGGGGNHHSRSCALATVVHGSVRYRDVRLPLTTDRWACKGRGRGEVVGGGGPSCSTSGCTSGCGSTDRHRARGRKHSQARRAGASPRGNGGSGNGNGDGRRSCGRVGVWVYELGRRGGCHRHHLLSCASHDHDRARITHTRLTSGPMSCGREGLAGPAR
jgi:hypothetical protein